MPFQVKWHIPNRIIIARAHDPLVPADFDSLQCGVVGLLGQAEANAPDKPVTLVYDATHVTYHPPLYLMLGKALPVLRFKNRGAVYAVSSGGRFHNLFRLTAHVMNLDIRVFEDVAEALRAAEDVSAWQGLHPVP